MKKILLYHSYSRMLRQWKRNLCSCVSHNQKGMTLCFKSGNGAYIPQNYEGQCPVRCKITTAESAVNIFDRKLKQKQRNWSASLSDGSIYDYIKDEIGNRVADRVYDISRTFEVGVELACGRGHVSKHITSENIKMMYQCDSAQQMVDISSVSKTVPTKKMVVDEEHLPFPSNSVDIFVSSLYFHWINDLPGVFQQIHNALKPDGVLIASMFGGDTLFELRCSLQLAETEREGGFAPHISPFTMVRDIGDLLNRTGYTMLTIDVDEIRVSYPTMFELLFDLQGMGESNAAWNRKLRLNKDSLIAAAAIYEKMYGNEDGSIPATFQVIYLIGWKPHDSQAKPAKRGSGTFSLKDLADLNKNI